MILPISISITIISNSTALEQRLLTLSMADNIPNIRTCSNETECENTDILIYDASSLPSQNYELKAINCLECILVAPYDKMDNIITKTSCWTALWIYPVSDTILEIYYHQVFNSALSKKEFSITKSFLNTLIDSVPDLIWFKDLRGSHIKVNEAFCRAVGKTKVECEGRGHYYIWDLEPEEYAMGEYVCLETEEEVIRQKRTCLFDEVVKSKNGLNQFKTYKSPLFYENGEMFGTVGVAKDVTDLQNIVRELEIILSGLPFASMIISDDDTIVSVNPKFCEYFNVKAEHILSMPYKAVCSKLLDTTPHQLENEHMIQLKYNHDGKQYFFNAHQQPINDIFGNHFGIFFLCLDVTYEYELQHRLIHSANTDFLTNLYNRRFFYEVISQKPNNEPLSVVSFDLDNFKKVNDTYGHQCGDSALILIALLLRQEFTQQLTTRMGGDEFVVTFFGLCIPDELEQNVKSFIDHANMVFRTTKNMEILTVSAGIACNGSCKYADLLLSCADKALYAAKAQGKARCETYNEACK